MSRQATGDLGWRHTLATLLEGVALWVFAGICGWLIVGPGYWVLYNLTVIGSTGNVEMFGIMVSEVWWAYFPALIAVGVACLTWGSRDLLHVAAGIVRRFSPPKRTG